ncbi:oligogalacturonate-specific porin KdgM family protein [Pseudomonas paraversuta]|uniref:oligogalacturonate-specific porin KdgM family protein n=1 Tax=Pseudomonas paraversuta TaxID=2750624 RepID=UPI0019345DDC|nr:oligogalacturonate-specific porin KdgM family protein [Pseudomonas paraversuta]
MTYPLNEALNTSFFSPRNAHVCKPGRYNGLIAALCFTALEGALMLMPTASHALDLDYQHQYNEKDRDHTDKVMITQALDNGLAFSFQMVASPAVKENGQPGQPFEHMTKDSLKGKVKYSHKLTKRLKFKPKFTYSQGKDKKSYKPAFKFPYELNNSFSVIPGYYYKLTTYKDDGKESKRDNVWSLGGKYRTDRMSIGIARKEIYSNQIAFDGKKRNYSNKFVIDYKVTHRFIPYFEVADVYVDKDTDERQARYRVGFKYKF